MSIKDKLTNIGYAIIELHEWIGSQDRHNIDIMYEENIISNFTVTIYSAGYGVEHTLKIKHPKVFIEFSNIIFNIDNIYEKEKDGYTSYISYYLKAIHTDQELAILLTEDAAKLQKSIEEQDQILKESRELLNQIKRIKE